MRLRLSHAINSLCSQLSGFDSLPSLAPLHTELGYVYYPRGGFYERHMDVGARATDAWQGERAISVLLYLNSGWRAAWGGRWR